MNDRFATQIIAHLVNQGVKKICLSPGSRSSLLAIAAAREPQIEKFVHMDERAMAFHAYGYAKATQSPVAILTTSGTATGNIFPAIMEASHDHVPLIVLTADRPTELQDCMANQTCDQVKMFGSYVRWYAEIPAAEPGISDRWLAGTIAHAVYRATLSPPGPVHLNCQFREPFFSGQTYPATEPVYYEQTQTSLSSLTVKKWAEKLSSYKKGVIIAGHMPPSKHQNPILTLAEKLDWPILADLMSSLRSEMNHPALIPYFIDILKSSADLKPDCILHLGDRTISKPLHQWIQNSKPSMYLMVASHPRRSDPFHQVTDRIVLEPSHFCEQVAPHVHPQVSWYTEWKSLSHLIEGHLDEYVPEHSEPGLIRYLHHHLPSHYAIYFANSMPIRDADRLFFPRHGRGQIFGQRGLSGIDGNIATAVGLAEGAGRPLVAVLGDQATLYDLSSLAILKKSKIPVILIVINNSGGGIFSFLPAAKQEDVFEEYMAGAHNWTFSKAAEMFKLPYTHLVNFEDLHRALRDERTSVLEFTTNRKENVAIHTAMDQKTRELIQHFGATL